MIKNICVGSLIFFCCCIGTVPVIAQQKSRSIVRPNPSTRLLIGRLTNGAGLWATKGKEGWGLRIENAGAASVQQPHPVTIEHYTDSTNIREHSGAYNSVVKTRYGVLAEATVVVNHVPFFVADHWQVQNGVAQVKRVLTVGGNSAGGFLSGLRFLSNQPRAQTGYFAPGMIYGSTSHLTETAIGGKKASTTVRIREDRLPAPLFGLHFGDGSSIALLNAKPDGRTTAEDSYDVQATTLTDERFAFGAIGAEEVVGKTAIGFWWPGSEGGTTYQGNTYPGGQMQQWRRRYHPVKKGLQQQYTLALRTGQREDFSQFYTAAWRWAWRTLKPQVYPVDVEAAKKSMMSMLSNQVEVKEAFTGLPMFKLAPHYEHWVDYRAVMGFVGKNIEAANFLLQNSDTDSSVQGKRQREQALALIASFTKLKMNPPVGEGVNMETGKPDVFSDHVKKVFLRPLGDDMKSLLKAYKREKAQGREHPEWLAWAQSFGDWLLTQEYKTGGFPRSFEMATGKIIDASPISSYTVVPFLLLLSELTGAGQYEAAAVRAAEMCWSSGQASGVFVGGTIDNPDVIDKEAGTLSTEAYLMTAKATGDQKWINRARHAADFAETWIYIWNIPMPANDTSSKIGWKKGVPTVGLQLISSGHSLTDVYMAFDVDEFASLYLLTKNVHYLEVATLLLHNTKAMLALPGRTYDLKGAGWQQEHWSMAPRRGYGLHRGWLPWVTTSHLNGIFGLQDLSSQLYRQLTKSLLTNQPDKK